MNERCPMLRMNGVTKRFGNTTAVDSLSLDVACGEFFVLLGPNGAGKTTTVRLIAGLLQLTGGSIRIAGRDVSRDDVGAKSLLGYVPDIPFLYDKLTVSEMLDFVAGVYGIPPGEADHRKDGALELFDLSRERHLLVEGLSHGMKQRLVYAMAMLHEPKLMLVDEPFTGLDPRNIRSVKEALRKIIMSGGAVFMCTHDLSAASELADRIGILSRGRLVTLGSPSELMRQAGGAAGLEEAFLRITEGHDDEALRALAARSSGERPGRGGRSK